MPSHRRHSRRVDDSSSESEGDGGSVAPLAGRRVDGKRIRKDRGRKDRPSRRKHQGRKNAYGVPYAYGEQACEQARQEATLRRLTAECVAAHDRLVAMRKDVAVYPDAGTAFRGVPSPARKAIKTVVARDKELVLAHQPWSEYVQDATKKPAQQMFDRFDSVDNGLQEVQGKVAHVWGVPVRSAVATVQSQNEMNVRWQWPQYERGAPSAYSTNNNCWS